MTYISMFVLQLIDDDTTQRELCDTLFYPKQTVNKVILTFEKKGFVKLIKNPKDKRSRSIILTDKGKAFQNKIVSHIERAELEAFASLTEQEQQIMTELWKKYTDVCTGKISGI